MSDNVHSSSYVSNIWKDVGDYYGLIITCTKIYTSYSVNEVDIRPSTSSINTRHVSPIPREKSDKISKRNHGRSLDVQLYSQGKTETIKNKFTMV